MMTELHVFYLQTVLPYPAGFGNFGFANVKGGPAFSLNSVLVRLWLSKVIFSKLPFYCHLYKRFAQKDLEKPFG